ncbi:MAG: DUF4838 domain-containing protein [Bacteroidales bacterium]|nr:DUF4838 domain-containing protein [Bacteroidales bacterium]
MKKLPVLILLLYMLTACNSEYFVHNGKSGYTIYVSQTKASAELRAAKLLQRYIEKMTGTILPVDSLSEEAPEKSIVLLQNDTIDPDGFVIERSNDQLLISGGSHKGCIYGVVHLLEHEWGMRKYSTDFEVIQAKKKLKLPDIHFADQPANSYRIINGRFCQNEDYQDWQRLDLISDQFADKYYVHTFNRLVPWEDYFDTHPEYFSMVDGRRIKDQLCLTNPDVLKIVIDKLREEMALQPDKKLWSVSQNDNFTYCQCEDCQKVTEEEGSPAGNIIRFVNAVAAEFPDKIISTLAYQYSRTAPTMVKPADNVQVMLCTIELNRSQPIADDPRSKSFLKDIEDWGRIANHIYLWDYTVNFSHHITPFPNLHVLQPNIQLFTENGIHNHFQQSNTDVGHEFSELKSYLIARLLWNPAVDVDSLILDFTDGYYGPAGYLVRDYLYSLQNDIVKTGEWLDIYGHPTAHENTFLAEDKINHYLDLFHEARALVADDSAYLMHVREAELPVQYAAMEIGKNHMFESRGWYIIEGDSYLPRTAMTEMLDDFINTCRLIHVNSISEGGLRPEDYYQASKRFIDVQIDGNLAFRKKVTASLLPSQKYSKGDITYLTNGVQGASDYKVHWLGWEAQDFSLTLDLDRLQAADSIMISSLYDPKSWIFHPRSVACSVSEDGKAFRSLGIVKVEGDQRNEPVTRSYSFPSSGGEIRFIRFDIKGTLQNPRWHPSAGGKSWVFIDEIVVR